MEAAGAAAALDQGQDDILVGAPTSAALACCAFDAPDVSFVDFDDLASAAHGLTPTTAWPRGYGAT